MQKSLVKSKINNLNKPEIKQAWYSTYGDSYEEGLRFLLKSIDSNSFASENLLEDIKNKKPIQYILGEWDFYTGTCLLYTSPSPRDRTRYRMPSSA